MTKHMARIVADHADTTKKSAGVRSCGTRRTTCRGLIAVFLAAFAGPPAPAGADWVFRSKATCPSGAPIESVAVSPNLLAAGAPSGATGGQVCLFDPRSASPAPLATLAHPSPSPGDEFGAAVALAPGFIVVGAPGDDTAVGIDAGSAVVFEDFAGSWTPVATLTPLGQSMVGPGDRFGHAVAVAVVNNTPTIAVGSPDWVNGHGAVYMFQRSGAGAWSLAQKLAPAMGIAPSDRFGSAVDMDGVRVAVGSEGADGKGCNDTGVCYVFAESGGNWSNEGGKQIASESATGDLDGHSVSIHGDFLLSGAPGTDLCLGTFSGCSCSGATVADSGGLYALSWPHAFGWAQEQVLGLLVYQGGLVQPGDRLGEAVSIHDGRGAFGAPLSDHAAPDAGMVHVYAKSSPTTGPNWHREAELVAFDAQPADQFGSALALDEGLLAVVGGGDAYVFVAAPDTSFKACGVGCAGPGGAPELHAGGDPTPGGTVTLTVTGAIPLTSALLFFGGMCAQPPVPIATMPGCALNIAPVNPFGLLLPIDQFGMGTMTSAPLPPLPSGLLGAVQAFVQDPAAPGGWVSTVGIEIHG